MEYSKILKPGLDARFHQALSDMLTRADIAAYAQMYGIIPSTTARNEYGWLGDVPSVEEWIGQKNYSGLKEYDYTIKNRDFSTGIVIDRNDLEDSDAINIASRVEDMAEAMAIHPHKLIVELLKNGENGLAYDGAAFFSDRGTNANNLLTGTGTTVAKLQTDISTARATMMKFPSDQGRPLGLRMDAIVCDPSLEADMLRAIGSPAVVTSGSGTFVNPVTNWINLILPVPELTDTNDWYGLALNRSVRPFFYQARKQPTPVISDSTVDHDRKIYYSVESRGNAAYGLWQLALKVTNT